MNQLARVSRLTLIALVAALSVVRLAIAADTLRVNVDQATLIKLPDKVGTIVIGNPLIADVTVQAGGTLVVTGKGYGVTNMVALDRQGNVVMERSVQVEGPRDKTVVVYRGVERETYSCQPRCERRITLGDSPEFFGATIGQATVRSGQAAGTPQQQQQPK